MKKIFLGLVVITLSVSSCRKDSTSGSTTIDIATQNSYDDQAAQDYLKTHYFDAKGNVIAYNTTTGDTSNPNLTTYNPVTLPSGVIYVINPKTQPSSGKTVSTNDILTLQINSISYLAQNVNNAVTYQSPVTFYNTIAGSGVPKTDPMWYHISQDYLNADTSKTRTYYEIEGFQEAITKFLSYEIPVTNDYALQGIIIVPSRAAFARDSYYPYSSVSLNDRSFIFNFQIYKTATR